MQNLVQNIKDILQGVFNIIASGLIVFMEWITKKLSKGSDDHH